MYSKKNLIIIIGIIIVLFHLINEANAQGQWAYVYGGANNEKPYCIMQSADNGFIAVGSSNSFGTGGDNYWIIKLNSTGNIIWQEYFQTNQNDIAYSIWQTIDGGYVIGGETSITSPPDKDLLIIKIDNIGNSNWQRVISSGYSSQFASIEQTTDNGYIIGASTLSNLSNTSTSSDLWVIKLNNSGSISWQYLYGSESNEYTRKVKQTSDQGYIVGGNALYNMTEHSDIWVIKLTSNGAVSWQRKYGWSFSATSNEYVYDIEQTSDSGYIIAGATNTYGAGNLDIWIFKLDSNGNIVWQRTYGGSMDDIAYSIEQTTDGGYVLAGYSDSVVPDNREAIVIKLDSLGNVLWQKRYGGSYSDEARSIKQTNDNGFIIAVDSYSYGSGFNDFLIIKTDANGEIDPLCNLVNNANLVASSTSLAPSSLTYNIAPASINTFTTSLSPLSEAVSEINICSSSPGAVPDNDNYSGTPLQISKYGTNQLLLNWGAPPNPCITTDYSIYRGFLPFVDYNHTYLQCTTGNSTNAIVQADSGNYYYLVVAQFGNLEGSYGVDSNNNQRPVGINYCYQRYIASCN